MVSGANTHTMEAMLKNWQDRLVAVERRLARTGTGGGGGGSLTVVDTPSIDLTLTGNGNPGTPWVLKGDLVGSGLPVGGVLTKRSVLTTQVFAAAGVDQTITWDQSLASSGHFTFTSPGTFTCVIPGTYEITLSVGTGQATSAAGWLAGKLALNGTIVMESLMDRDTPGGRAVNGSITLTLVAGDTLTAIAASRFAESGVVNLSTRTFIELVPVSVSVATTIQPARLMADLPTLGPGVNLDTVLETGWYIQNLSASATSALNYPVARAGHLEVSGGTMGGSPDFAMQTYTEYAPLTPSTQTRQWRRTMYGGGSWYNWVLVSGENETANIKMCSGQYSIAASVAAAAASSQAVTFPTGFFSAPPVMVTAIANNGRVTMAFASLSATGVTFGANNWSPAAMPAGTTVLWAAWGVGP